MKTKTWELLDIAVCVALIAAPFVFYFWNMKP